MRNSPVFPLFADHLQYKAKCHIYAASPAAVLIFFNDTQRWMLEAGKRQSFWNLLLKAAVSGCFEAKLALQFPFGLNADDTVVLQTNRVRQMLPEHFW